MSLSYLDIQPLTKANFADFGEVIETDGAKILDINLGRTQRFHALGHVELGASDDKAIISLFRSNRWAHPLHIKMMEQHPMGSQAFLPVDKRPFLVVVADKDTHGEPSAIRGFVTNGHQGINLYTGVWHHPQLILAETQDFMVIDRMGSGNNLIEQDLPAALQTYIDLNGAIARYLEN